MRLLDSPIRIFRLVLRACVSLCEIIAGLRRPVAPLFRHHRTWDLLIAQRIAQRVRDEDAVLDVGCGTGHTLAELALFRRVRCAGVDLKLVPDRFPDIPMQTFDGRNLRFPDGAFDVTLVCFVLHHLPHRDAIHLLDEAVRVTRRRLIVIEDSLARFDALHRLRNRLHILETGLAYRSESSHYTPPPNDTFLTHDEWKQRLASLPRASAVTVEPLAGVSLRVHHTLIDVELEPIGPGEASVSGNGRSDSPRRRSIPTQSFPERVEHARIPRFRHLPRTRPRDRDRRRRREGRCGAGHAISESRRTE